ncbi:MAG: cellulase family glycosylhydrolase [Deltaproteobacteria bacterium]|nr:cellulase family glycosylhydrolase [Deltaproteobacteria bacterium]
MPVCLLACSPPSPSADVLGDATSDANNNATDAEPADVARRLPMPACEALAGPFRPLSTRCQHMVDAQGRVVVLRGVNARVQGVFDVTFSDGRAPLQAIPAFEDSDAQRMRQLGLNVLRLPINWSGVEPSDQSPPSYNEEYLAKVQATIQIAARAGLRVLVDFHQDAYSKEIGEDGAPLWAISPAPDMLLSGPLTVDELTRRRTSGQVIRAFETFFGDMPRGAVLRQRFAQMASMVARRLRAETSIIGYEIYNEPLASDEQCERLHLEVGAAIRREDPEALLFFEPPAVRNLLDQANLPSAPFALPGAVYSPHIYTLALTGNEPARENFTRASLRLSHAAAFREARAWGTPTFVTEWGYGPNATRVGDYVEAQQDLHDEFGASAAIWLWKERSQGSWGLFDYDPAADRWTERAAYRRALARVYPEAIAGWPEQWRYDRAMRTLTLRFAGLADASVPSVIYVPAAEDFARVFTVTCDGAALPSVRDASTGQVQVRCGGPGMHTITLSGRD